MRILVLVVLLATLLPGCATRWTKPGEDWVDFNEVTARREIYECERDARSVQFFDPVIGLFFRPMYFRRCMRAHGYVEAE